jgi:hypothetical protein
MAGEDGGHGQIHWTSRPRADDMLFPKEHGAYGQMAFPLATSLIAARPSPGGLLIAATVIAGFLAHEPAAVLLGARGPRERRERGRSAARQLAACVCAGAVSALGALTMMDAAARWTLLYPAVPALTVAAATVLHRETSPLGEVATALAFSAAAVPVARAGGAPMRDALSIAIPFAMLFIATTLAVRVAVLGVRGGGDPPAVAATRRAVVLLSVAGIAGLGTATITGVLPAVAGLAAAPGIAVALAIAVRPPHPARLRAVGWTLVAVTMITAGMLITWPPRHG